MGDASPSPDGRGKIADLRTAPAPIPGIGKAAPGRETAMLYRLGRLMQLSGMVILPLAIVANLAPPNTPST